VTQVKVDERWMEWWCMLEGKVIHICAYICVCVRPDQGTKAYGCWLSVDRGRPGNRVPYSTPGDSWCDKERARVPIFRSLCHIWGSWYTFRIYALS
jgi:hypothetical protein